METSNHNTGDIKSLKFRLAEQDGKVADQDNEIRSLLKDIEDLENQSLKLNSNIYNTWQP